MSKNYLGVEDILCDDNFLSWYFKTDPAAMRLWEDWLQENPLHRERVEQAIDFLHSLRLEEAGVSGEQLSYAEIRLLNKIREAEARVDQAAGPDLAVVPLLEAAAATGEERDIRAEEYRSVKVTWMRRWRVAAAILVLLAGFAGAYWWLTHSPQVHTDFGEIREKRLPDGSEVVLNADSRIVLSKDWKEGQDREVWLTGEAFFHVQKTPQKSRFIVHTNHFDILVTGTQFNVVDRPGKANVMLKEGSVTLHTPEGREWKMSPGDFVEYHSSGLEKRPVKNDSVLAWKDHKLIFDNTPLREVARIIREHYGVQVQLADDYVGSMTISGILPNDNLDILLQSLDATLDFEVEHVVHEGGTITISRRNN